jgi:hypothetical protein
MITIFCDFRQFSAKKLALFSKTNVMIKILHTLALSQKRQFFRNFFWRKYFLNHNIGPRLTVVAARPDEVEEGGRLVVVVGRVAVVREGVVGGAPRVGRIGGQLVAGADRGQRSARNSGAARGRGKR